MNLMVSVITVSYNQGEFIEDNIQSVLNQRYKNFEHIIIDGGSKDSTVDVLKRYSHLNWISESDNGQSHALNKGFKKASGEIIAWINSDDKLAPDALNIVVDFFLKTPNTSTIVGDLKLVDKNNKYIKIIKGYSYTNECLKYRLGGVLNQPSTFFRRSVFEKIGFIDENLHYCMDYDFFLRLSSLGEVCHLPYVLAEFRIQDDSKTSQGQIHFFYETLKVLKKYHISWWKTKSGKSAVYVILTEPLRRIKFLRKFIQSFRK